MEADTEKEKIAAGNVPGPKMLGTGEDDGSNGSLMRWRPDRLQVRIACFIYSISSIINSDTAGRESRPRGRRLVCG